MNFLLHIKTASKSFTLLTFDFAP